MQLSIQKIPGPDIEPHFADISGIRQTVFREWPYLYQGSDEYEREYFENFMQSQRALCILIQDGSKTVGLTTLMPLAEEHDELKQPVADYGLDIHKIFYFAETCILPEYRGSGLYKQLFQMREDHANSFGDDYTQACFCSVIRPSNHALKPDSYKPLDEIWRRYGYRKISDLHMRFSWQDIDQSQETRKDLVVWTKSL